MSIHVYSIWTHQLENGDYYSYCPQFPGYYSIALTSFDAVVRLSDVILSAVNYFIERDIEPIAEEGSEGEAGVEYFIYELISCVVGGGSGHEG